MLPSALPLTKITTHFIPPGPGLYAVRFPTKFPGLPNDTTAWAFVKTDGTASIPVMMYGEVMILKIDVSHPLFRWKGPYDPPSTREFR